MKILVTGANGYLGVGIVKAILDSGNDVVAVDFKVNHVDSRATKMECDLFEVENPFRFCGEPDILLHLAWKDGFVHYSDAHINDSLFLILTYSSCYLSTKIRIVYKIILILS